MQLDSTHELPIRDQNKQLASIYNQINQFDWLTIDELQKSKQILGLIKSILKSRNEQR